MLCVYILLEGGNSLLQFRCLGTMANNLHALLKHLPGASGNTNLELEQWLHGNLKHCIFNVSLGTLLRLASGPTPRLPQGAVPKASSYSSQPRQPHSESDCSQGRGGELPPTPQVQAAKGRGPEGGRNPKQLFLLISNKSLLPLTLKSVLFFG